MSFISFRKGLGSGTVNTSAFTLQMQYGELGSRFPTTSVDLYILEECINVENPVIYEYIKRGGYTVR